MLADVCWILRHTSVRTWRHYHRFGISLVPEALLPLHPEINPPFVLFWDFGGDWILLLFCEKFCDLTWVCRTLLSVTRSMWKCAIQVSMLSSKNSGKSWRKKELLDTRNCVDLPLLFCRKWQCDRIGSKWKEMWMTTTPNSQIFFRGVKTKIKDFVVHLPGRSGSRKSCRSEEANWRWLSTHLCHWRVYLQVPLLPDNKTMKMLPQCNELSTKNWSVYTGNTHVEQLSEWRCKFSQDIFDFPPQLVRLEFVAVPKQISQISNVCNSASCLSPIFMKRYIAHTVLQISLPFEYRVRCSQHTVDDMKVSAVKLADHFFQ